MCSAPIGMLARVFVLQTPRFVYDTIHECTWSEATQVPRFRRPASIPHHARMHRIAVPQLRTAEETLASLFSSTNLVSGIINMLVKPYRTAFIKSGCERYFYKIVCVCSLAIRPSIKLVFYDASRLRKNRCTSVQAQESGTYQL